MFEQIMEINANFLLQSIKFLPVVLIFSILFRAIFPSTKEFRLDELVICTVKLGIYGALAVYIYWNVYTNDYREINVLTFFTYILAAVEFTHNFMITIGASISAGVRTLYEHLVGKNI